MKWKDTESCSGCQLLVQDLASMTVTSDGSSSASEDSPFAILISVPSTEVRIH